MFPGQNKITGRLEAVIAWVLIIALVLTLAVVIINEKLKERDMALEVQRREVVQLQNKLIELEKEYTELDQAYFRRLGEIIDLQLRVLELQQENEEMNEVLQWDVRRMNVTHYAPFDPDAVEGFDYWGDPGVTSSGEPTQIGVTVAAGPEVPFGTELYIPGYGFREVHDRGGAITRGKLDIAIESRSEAYRLGRQNMTVYLKPN